MIERIIDAHFVRNLNNWWNFNRTLLIYRESDSKLNAFGQL